MCTQCGHCAEKINAPDDVGHLQMIGPDFTSHLLVLTDDTGLAQHARYHFVDRSHGYCLDDNARAVTVLCRLARLQALTEREQQALANCAAFVDHAFDRSSGQFRNFMSFERLWLEEEGADDASARAAHALGVVISIPPQPWMRHWARDLFEEVVPRLHKANSPRSWSFILMALNMVLRSEAPWPAAEQLREDLALRLLQRWRDAAKPDWPWFEDVLGYDNGRLAEAAIATGAAIDIPDLRDAGFSALEALWEWQFDGRVFHPVGSESFGHEHQPPQRFDQQPIDVHAMIDACQVAARVAPEPDFWRDRAEIAMAWFFGRNDLEISLAELDNGLCHDGLHPDRINANAGAESTLAYLGATISMLAPETLS